MDKRLKNKWLKALRSRKYKQGQNYLKYYADKLPEHCCLGVLCEVAGVSGEVVDNLAYFGNSSEVLDNNLRTKFKISEKEMNILTAMNDGEFCPDTKTFYTPKKFYQIARWIERNL